MWCCRLLLLETGDAEWDTPLFFVGVGCLFSWTSVIQFLEAFPQYYSLIVTLKTSSPRVLAFLVGVLPIFLGFACFGVAYFSTYSEKFSNVDQASVTLFALLNGDVIHDVFYYIFEVKYFFFFSYKKKIVIVWFYFFLFVCVFLCVYDICYINIGCIVLFVYNNKCFFIFLFVE